MGKRGIQRYVNERFFDGNTRKTCYVWGALFGCYTPFRDNGLIIRNSCEELVQIVRDLLEPEPESRHDIISHNRRNSHWIQIGGVPTLRSQVEKLGLVPDKSQREFPEDIEEKRLPDFMRGASDAVINDTGLGITYHHPSIDFLQGWYDKLVLYAGVKPGKNILGHGLCFGLEDKLKIYKCLYHPTKAYWDYIRTYGLYTPSKKELFRPSFIPRRATSPKKIAAEERVKQAKSLLLEGYSWMEVAEELGYQNPNALSRAFRNETGETVTDFISRNAYKIRPTKKIERAKILFGRGYSLRRVSKELDYHPDALSRAFKNITGENITNYFPLPPPRSNTIESAKRVERAKRLFRKGYSLKETAKKLDCRPSSLSRAFKRVTGEAVTDFAFYHTIRITTIKASKNVKKTKSLLLEGHSLSEVASELDRHPDTISKAFKRETGKTITEFLEENRALVAIQQ